MAKIYVDNDMTISLSGTGKLTYKGEPVVGASVKAFLYDINGSAVEGASWPIILSDLGKGEYSGILPDTVSIVAGSEYDLEISAEKDGANAKWKQRVKAEYRSFKN